MKKMTNLRRKYNSTRFGTQELDTISLKKLSERIERKLLSSRHGNLTHLPSVPTSMHMVKPSRPLQTSFKQLRQQRYAHSLSSEEPKSSAETAPSNSSAKVSGQPSPFRSTLGRNLLGPLLTLKLRRSVCPQ